MIYWEHTLPLFWLIAVLAAVVAAGLASFWRHRPGNPVLAAGLAALFLAAAGLSFWALLMPGRRETVTERLRPRFLVALDVSQSMTLAPDGTPSNRWDRARAAMALPWARLVGAECQIDTLPFDGDVGPVLGLHEAGAAQPTGAVTRVNDALRDIAGRYAGVNVAGLLLLSDGLDTREASEDWAREPRPFPVYTVGLEDEKEWVLPPDLRVEAVNTPLRATLNWTTELKALLYGQGTGTEPVTVQLFKNGVLLDEKPTRFPEAGGQREAVFTLTHTEAGIFSYRVCLPPLNGESNTNDNERIVSVHVSEDKNRLLYVEGVPRWEYRFLRRVLLAGEDVAAVIFYTGPDGSPRMGSPAGGVSAAMTEADLTQFKVVILGNLDAGELSESRAQSLVRFVETGGSLILLGGNKAWGTNGFAQTSLSRVLPARGLQTAPLEAASGGTPFPVRLTDEARNHPAFAGDEGAWASLPSILSVFPGAAPSLGAQVLVEAETAGGRQPVVVSHRYGAGKVAAVFSDSLWRWQLAPDGDRARPYPRFWIQMIAWMLPDEEEADKRRLDVFADRDRVYLGEAVEISARLPGAEDAPPDRIEAVISFPDARQVPYAMAARHIVTAAGEAFSGYALDFKPELPGNYSVTVSAGEGAGRLASPPLSFYVHPYSPETVPKPVRTDLLKALAAASGGRYFESLAELDAALSDLQVAVIQEERFLFHSLWQRWPVIILLMGLLAGAWALRKSRNLP